MREKPNISRSEEDRDEVHLERLHAAAKVAMELIDKSEVLGTPERIGDHISFPIYRNRNEMPQWAEVRRTEIAARLHTAPFESGVI